MPSEAGIESSSDEGDSSRYDSALDASMSAYAGALGSSKTACIGSGDDTLNGLSSASGSSDCPAESPSDRSLPHSDASSAVADYIALAGGCKTL